ncbi:MAG: copper homeostasis protein CutC [Planctomycetota bacterium]|nr:copper homeostasis protein CutC [Planctomycetota bacterium]
MKPNVSVEVCVETLAGARAAVEAGVQRIELCTGLELGGLTPSAGLIEAVLKLPIETVVLIRPRAGDFVYDADETRVMEQDIRAARSMGVGAFAIGALRPDGSIDSECMAQMIYAACSASICCHRAFDGTRDPLASLRLLGELGVTRLLTSGQAQDALIGASLIRELVQSAPPTLAIMPGGGIRPHNVGEILESTGARNIHFSARADAPDAMQYTNPNCDLHNQPRSETSVAEIARYLGAI